MANYKLKISIIFIALGLFLGSNLAFSNENVVNTKTPDYEEIYEGLIEPDFNYIFGLDPYQADDYTKYMYSPYPLFRSGVTLVFKSKKIPPGYYLLTPREKDGKTWVLFKENGRISYVIPVYKEDTVLEAFYEDKFPHPKLTFTQKLSKKTMGFIGTKWGHKNQRTPVPQSYVEFDDRGDFWDMALYFGSKKYYLLFRKG